MQHSISVPDVALPEPSETELTSGPVDDVNFVEVPHKKSKREKQVSAMTVTTGESTEHKSEDHMMSFSDDGEEDEADENAGGAGCGRGIIADFKRTVGTHWLQEMTNFNEQTVAVSFFIFFAAISPASE
jgi:hypothetical protein